MIRNYETKDKKELYTNVVLKLVNLFLKELWVISSETALCILKLSKEVKLWRGEPCDWTEKSQVVV